MKQLQQQKIWCVWQLEPDDGRLTKVPHHPTGKLARPNDPRTWATYRTARQYEKDYKGIGYFFPSGLAGVDVDGDHTEGGASNPLESEVCELFKGTYQEKSPSGTGVHIVFYVDLNRLPEGYKERYYQNNSEGRGLECYIGGATNKYFTYTGNRISDGEEVTDQTDALLVFLDKYMRKDDPANQKHTEKKGPTAAEDFGTVAPGPVDMAARLNMARNAANGGKFRRLYDLGDISEYSNDDSVADQALCELLAFWLNNDPDLIDKAFRASALYREKWERKDYSSGTIKKGITFCNDRGGPYKEPRFKYRPANSLDLTDGGNAEVFSAMFRDRLRWCDALGWLVWDGKKWDQNDHTALGIALDFSKNMLLEAIEALKRGTITDTNGNTSVDPAAKAYITHAKKTRAKGGINNILDLAKARLNILAAALDSDPYQLNTEAGIVDLHTGGIRPHDPTAFCTKIAPCTPSAEGAELWENFLDLITEGDVELKDFLRQVCGSAAIGLPLEEGLFFAYGKGRNGKSTFFNALQTVLGDYAGTINPDTLTQDKSSKEATYATLRGKRLVVCSELEEGQYLSVKALKRIASNDHKLTVERKYHDPEEITPTHTICLHTNNLPRVTETDFGTERRLTVIPFNATMPEGQADVKNYGHILAEKAGGAILQWLISGAVDYLAAGSHLPKSDAVEMVTREYQVQENWLNSFIRERCLIDGKEEISAKLLYQCYEQYAKDHGESPKDGRQFKHAMENAGYKNVLRRNYSFWQGIVQRPTNYGADQKYIDEHLPQ